MQVLFDYMAHLTPNKYERFQVYRWLVTLLTRQNWKIPGLLVHTYRPGTGKTMLFVEFIRPILGEKMTSAPNVNDLGNTHRTWMVNRTVTLLDDIPARENRKLAEDLKTVQTADMIQINPKNLPTRMIHNHVTLYATSQTPIAVMLERDDRRWIIARSSSDKIDESLLKRVLKFVRGDGLRNVMWLAENFENLPKWAKKEIQPGLGDVPPEALEPSPNEATATYENEQEKEIARQEATKSLSAMTYLPDGKPAPWTYSKAETIAKSASEPIKRAMGILGEVIAGEGKELAFYDTLLYRSIVNHAAKQNDAGLMRSINPTQLAINIGTSGLYSCAVNRHDPNMPNPYKPLVEKNNGDGTEKHQIACALLLSPTLVDRLEADGLIKVNHQNRTYEPQRPLR